MLLYFILNLYLRICQLYLEPAEIFSYCKYIFKKAGCFNAIAHDKYGTKVPAIYVRIYIPTSGQLCNHIYILLI